MLEEFEHAKLLNQENGSSNETEEVIGPLPRPNIYGLDGSMSPAKEIERPDELKVKVFVINEDGNWSDCGIGTLIFISNTEVVICSDDNDLKERDVIAPDRANKLRGGHGKDSLEIMNADRGELLVKLNLKKAKDFIKTQSKLFFYFSTKKINSFSNHSFLGPN